MVHNHYISASPSGEDIAFDNERQLLQQAGHEVVTYTRHNDDISESPMDRLSAIAELYWSRRTYRELKALIKKYRPEVAHFHNTFPLVSASGYAACKESELPVVQTLHNYRLICPGALLLRDGKPCEKCIGNVMLPAIQHGCYRNSKVATALIAGMLNFNRMRDVYRQSVDRYICLTPLARERMIRGGLPAEKCVVRTNAFLNPPATGSGDGGYALFVGRLASEKGVKTLVEAWHSLDYPLKIAGDGPLHRELEKMISTHSNIELLGRKTRSEVLTLMQRATLLVIPSEWYEGFPNTALEALATGTPLLVSSIGALDEIVTDPVNGKKFQPGNAMALRDVARYMLSNPAALKTMRLANRLLFDSRYSPQKALGLLEQVYRDVIAEHSTKPVELAAIN